MTLPVAFTVVVVYPGVVVVTVTVTYDYPSGLDSVNPLPRYYTITPEGSGAYTASLALCYTDAEVSQAGADESDLRPYRFNGSNWEVYSSAIDLTTNVITATRIVTLSQWAIAEAPPVPAISIAKMPDDQTVRVGDTVRS